jgi:hypothetical protein
MLHYATEMLAGSVMTTLEHLFEIAVMAVGTVNLALLACSFLWF